MAHIARRFISARHRDCRGGVLIEALVAVMVFSLVGTAVLVGLSVTHRSGAETEGQSVAENVARNQMENAFSLPYQAPLSTYPPISAPAGYSVTATADWEVLDDTNLERVTVTIHREGRDILVLETFRARD
ncbi:MAG: type II secretion system protein [Chloroflexi bacterium]|nr:type II secretion system protein [Chloroflexota bacterium]